MVDLPNMPAEAALMILCMKYIDLGLVPEKASTSSQVNSDENDAIFD